MRSTKTKARGIIQLIESGSGLIVGQCMLAGCHEVTRNMAENNFESHQVEDLELLKKWRFAWRLCNVEKYQNPIPYTHPQGAVIWVNLPAS